MQVQLRRPRRERAGEEGADGVEWKLEATVPARPSGIRCPPQRELFDGRAIEDPLTPVDDEARC